MSSHPTTSTRRRAGLLALTILTAATFASGCSTSSTGGTEAVQAASPAVVDQTSVSAGSSEGTVAGATAPSEVVRADHDLVAFAKADVASAQRTLPAKTELGSPTALLVTATLPGWVEVLVPGRPTGATAWLRTDGLTVTKITSEIKVDLAARTLTLTDNGKVVLTTPVGIGADATPTPKGRFSVTDKLDTQNPGGSYGRYAFGLSGRSEVLTEFAGGDGQIGIHGTDHPESIGQNVSHGCIRVPNEVMEKLTSILPLGTPVVVS